MTFPFGGGVSAYFSGEASLHFRQKLPFAPRDCNWHPAPEDLGEVSEVFKVSRTAAPAPQASMVAGQSFRRWSWGRLQLPPKKGAKTLKFNRKWWFQIMWKRCGIIYLKHLNKGSQLNDSTSLHRKWFVHQTSIWFTMKCPGDSAGREGHQITTFDLIWGHLRSPFCQKDSL